MIIFVVTALLFIGDNNIHNCHCNVDCLPQHVRSIPTYLGQTTQFNQAILCRAARALGVQYYGGF